MEDSFNPFQPEVMDIWSILPKYRGKLAFYGGLSMQKTLPFGNRVQVIDESGRLLQLGKESGYFFPLLILWKVIQALKTSLHL